MSVIGANCADLTTFKLEKLDKKSVTRVKILLSRISCIGCTPASTLLRLCNMSGAQNCMEALMIALRKTVAALFVDRTSQQWVVLDREGNFWMLPTQDEKPWEGRQPFHPTDASELERVPNHYAQMLGLE